MGYWAFKEGMKFFIEDGRVYAAPGCPPLPRDPKTLEPIKDVPEIKQEEPKKKEEPVSVTIPAPAPTEEAVSPLSLSQLKGEVEPEAVNPALLKHASNCKSGGRGGRYTPGCPKCDFLSKDK